VPVASFFQFFFTCKKKVFGQVMARVSALLRKVLSFVVHS
jgi:hypothetical protein